MLQALCRIECYNFIQAGATSAINIRNYKPINSASPLVVIDGVTVAERPKQTKPQHVDNISVIKDASAAAIYGQEQHLSYFGNHKQVLQKIASDSPL